MVAPVTTLMSVTTPNDPVGVADLETRYPVAWGTGFQRTTISPEPPPGPELTIVTIPGTTPTTLVVVDAAKVVVGPVVVVTVVVVVAVVVVTVGSGAPVVDGTTDDVVLGSALVTDVGVL